MSRRTLSRVGAYCAVLGGLILALVAAVSLATTLALASGWTPSSLMSGGPIALFAVLAIASSVAPVAVLIGLVGLHALLDEGSLAGRWGLTLSAAAMLLLFAAWTVPYFLFGGDPNPSSEFGFLWTIIFFSSAVFVLRTVLLATGLFLLFVAAHRSGVLGPWRLLLPALGVLAVVGTSLSFLGSSGAAVFSEVLALVSGLLWIALGAAIWRHAPNAGSHNIQTAPASS